jgi:hypothetical protein
VPTYHPATSATSTIRVTPTCASSATWVARDIPAAGEARGRAGRESWERRRAEEEEAEARAESLLKRHLADGQRAEYEMDRSFHVVTGTGRRYRLRHGWAGNVEEVDAAGKRLRRYCIHPRIGVPCPDNLLAQKLLLEADEPEFHRIANVTPIAA